jgi:hypothetical protein
MKKFIKLLLIVMTFGLIANSFANTPVMVHNSVADIISVGKAGTPMAFAAVAKRELREKELIKHFRHKGTWLETIPSKNKWVNNDVIKLNEIGGDPEVLINNNTYPIAVNSRTDSSIAIALYKYDTTNTKITKDEMYALPYDKPGSVQEQHRMALEEKTEEHALHSLAPMGNTTDTPVITTTGPDDGTGRKRLVYKDLVNLKTKLGLLKVPKKGRVLVLSAQHVADLLIEDKALNIQYQNHKEGAIVKNYAGFEIYESVYSPEYDATTLDKIPFGSATTGKQASVVFYRPATAKARGSVEVFMREAKNDPENRETVLGMRLYMIAIPLKKKGQAAIISG